MGDLLVEGAREASDLSGQPSLARVQGPPFSVGEAGEVEGQQGLEGPLGLIEAALKLLRRGPQGRDGGRTRSRDRAPRIAQ
jgi:hypothetical protein